jgi:glycosyltransferase involved in cell wall biosynthesis
MLILQTAHSYPPEASGVAEVVRQISERLVQRGHEVHVATSAVSGAAAEEQLNGVWVHRFQVRGKAVTGIQGETDRYLSFVRSREWDVVAPHCAPSCTTDLVLPHIDSIAGAKVFVGHSLSELSNPQYGEYFRQLGKTLSRFNAVVTLSEMLEESAFCAAHGLPPAVVIPNGADLVEWAAPKRNVRTSWGIGPRPWVLSVSNHSPVKGHPAFFQMARKLSEKLPNPASMIIGNSYPAEKWRVGKLGIKGGCWYSCAMAVRRGGPVTLRSNVPRGELVSAVQEADLLAITSSREASPVVLMEAMAAGTPWISFDVGCVRQQPGGVVVSSPEEMAAVALELLSDEDRRRQLGAEGLRHVREQANWEAIAARYEQLYSAVAAKGKIL